MTRAIEFRTGCTVASAVAASMLLAGCVSSPTYGTGKTANAQLVEDLSNLVSIVPPKRDSEVAYAPRPDIVKPPEGATLPAPQTSLASAENPRWPESPEETRARLRQEAEENAGGTYRSPLAGPDSITKEQAEEFRKAKAEQRSLNAGTTRKYLTDPPAEYREPAETAPTDDLGEPERDKERRRKRAAQKDKGFKIGNLWPF